MPRKTTIYTVTSEDRDIGKKYLITEMPASRAEKWAARAFLAMAHSGIEIPANIMDAGFAGLALMGLRSLAGVNFDEAEPLLDEMMTCAKFLPNGMPIESARVINEEYGDVEEPSTLVKLRAEVFKLHINFSMADAILTSPLASAKTSPDSSSTPMSQEASPQS